MVRPALLATAVVLASLAASASASAPAQCPGDAIAPDRAITGEFGTDLEKSYVLVPFDVPAGTTAVRVKYCYDEPDANPQVNHTLDLGLYEPRADESDPWGPAEFRGWGGSSHPDVTVSAAGFSPEQDYLADPKGHVPGRTTRGFLPGPIEAGEWAAELGVAAVVSQLEGDMDGRVAWRLEVELTEADTGPPYDPARYSEKPARRGAGWYAGDLHVHAEHSALGDATMNEVFDFAFSPRPEGAGLDFLTLSDYVSGGAWGEIGRHQETYPDRLIIPSAEVITYRGHTNSHSNTTYMDYRTGPLYERATDGTLKKVRAATPPRLIFDRVHAAGGVTQINHPTIFPSDVPAFANLCRGCPWDYSDAQTDYTKVDTWEVHTGPAGFGDPPVPNPFTLTAIDAWDALRAEGHRVTAVAVSDSHNAGRTPGGITQSPIGQGTTMVFAEELSREAIMRAIRLGHVFVKVWSSDAPDLRLDAVTPDGARAMMGDPLAATEATFTARVTGGGGEDRRLIVLRDGQQILTRDVTSDDFEGDRAGDYRLQLERGAAIDGLTNPITLGAKPLEIRAKVKPKRTWARRKRRQFVFDVNLRAQDRVLPLAAAVVRFRGKRARTGPDGRAVVRARVRKPGRYRARITKAGVGDVRRRVRVRRAR
ncbi:MAG TPA: CehA/McbA family metallohydrolase [Thermoleophilaceae bacterium]|nr:CehA/McbA family metallohydrolase [Thermoleophilaceae bacterium]